LVAQDVAAEPGPVFVGGVVRSGTHVLGALIGSSTRYALIPREMVFHAAPNGLPGLLGGAIDLDTYVSSMETYFWERPANWDQQVKRGLFKTIPRSRLDGALRELRKRYPADPVQAARVLVRELLDPYAEAAGKPSWVETTPTNVRAAPTLAVLVPAGRFVHVTRDGRDVACSLARLPWGPPTVEEGIQLWEEQLRLADEALRQAPAEQVLGVQLEALLLTDRENSFQAVVDFLGISEPAVADFFASEVTPEKGHLGRWRTELNGGVRRRVEALYAAALERLSAAGVSSVPQDLLPDGYSISRARGQRSNVDPWADGSARDA
jgi:hypothetical protein